MFQYFPQIIREPLPLRSYRSLGAFAFNNLPGNDKVRISVKWYAFAQNFVYHHSKRLTVRRFRPMAVFEADPFRVEELWAHPSDGTTLCR